MGKSRNAHSGTTPPSGWWSKQTKPTVVAKAHCDNRHTRDRDPLSCEHEWSSVRLQKARHNGCHSFCAALSRRPPARAPHLGGGPARRHLMPASELRSRQGSIDLPSSYIVDDAEYLTLRNSTTHEEVGHGEP